MKKSTVDIAWYSSVVVALKLSVKRIRFALLGFDF